MNNELLDDTNSIKSIVDIDSVISHDSITSTNSNVSNLSINTCRICLEEVSIIKYFCDCKGTICVIHEECLLKWITTNNIDKCEICKCNYSIQKNKHIIWANIVSYILFIIILAALYYLIFVKYNTNFFLFVVSILCLISLCIAMMYLNYNIFVSHTIVLHELYDNALDYNYTNINTDDGLNNTRINSSASSTTSNTNSSTTSNETIPLLY